MQATQFLMREHEAVKSANICSSKIDLLSFLF